MPEAGLPSEESSTVCGEIGRRTREREERRTVAGDGRLGHGWLRSRRVRGLVPNAYGEDFDAQAQMTVEVTCLVALETALASTSTSISSGSRP